MSRRKGKKRVNWKKIAIALYESSGCGCCADSEKLDRALKIYGAAMKNEEGRC